MTGHARLDAASELLRSSIAQRIFPAAVAEVGSASGSIWHSAFGTLSFDDGADPAREDTIFDLASLTKPLATTSLVLDLASRGLMPLDTRIASLIPEWSGADRRDVTVQDLLEHAGGLSARLLDQPPLDARAFEHEICAMPLEHAPRTRALYSDLGFILLAFACERRGDAPFPELVDTLLRVVLASGDGPGSASLMVAVPREARMRTAPTQPLPEDHRRGARLVGEVHDNYAAALGGMAGHAGLFGTAGAVGAFARLVLRAARGDTSLPSPFTPDTVVRAATRSRVAGSSRALGWDTMLPTSSCGSRLSPAAFGHVGFTGTSLWIDPSSDRYYVLLTNRVCDGGTSAQMQDVRRAFHDCVSTL